MIFLMKDYRAHLLSNIKKLMTAKGLSSQNELAKKTHLNQKTINNLFNAEERSLHPSGETIKEIANYFHVDEWMLLAPVQIVDLLQNKALEQLIFNYRDSNQKGKQEILRVAEREVRYTSIPDNNNSTDDP